MARPTSTGSRRSRLGLTVLLAALAVAVAAALAGGAFADNVQNNAATVAGITTITAGGSTTITYNLVGNSAPNGDASGCDATSGSPVHVTVNVPSGASANPASFDFTGCGTSNTKTVSFSSATAGTYSITHSISGGISGSKFNDQADFTLTVNPVTPTNTAPTLHLPSDITTEATSSAGAVVTYSATATDTQDGTDSVSCSPLSGSTFAIGTTEVDCSTTDSGGLTTTGQFNVTVQDTTAPTLHLPADKTVEATGPSGAVVTYTATATDAVDGTDTVSCSPTSGSTFALGTTEVDCSSTDAHSNTATGHFNVTVQDTTAPTLHLPADKTVEATGPSGAVVTYTATATDAVDGTDTVSCSPTSGSTFALGTTEVDCSATDNAGNPASGSFNVTVQDTTPPDSGSISINSGATWTNSTSVTLALSAHDAVGVTGYRLAETSAGLDTASTVSVTSASNFSDSSVPFTLSSGDSASKSVYVRYYDAAGNHADTSSSIGLDTVKPKITGSTGSYTPGTWTNQSVTVSFTCADDQGSANSGIASNNVAGDTLTNTGANQSVTNTGICTDTAGNAADAVTVSNIDIDKIAPSVNCDSADGNWHANDVSISCTASDTGGSGLADSGDASFNLSTSVASGTETSNASTGSHDVYDAAGNKTTAGPISGNMIDKKAPSITCGTTPTFTLGQLFALVTGTATDGGSGPASQSVSAAADTSHVGSYNATLTANDNVSNQSTKSCPYTVAYGWSGFLQPINDTAHFVGETTSVFKAGSTVPVKFQLTDATGLPVQEGGMGPVWLNPQKGGALPSTATVDESTYAVTATAGGYYRWDSTGLQYIYNWNTSKGQAGYYYRIGVTLDDGSTYYVSIGLK